MSKSNALEAALLDLIFQATPFPNIADNASVGPLTQLQITLHTADPGEGGAQNTSECTYAGYARQQVARSSSGWNRSGSDVKPNADIVFPTATGGSETVTFFGIGSAASGAGVLYYSGAVSPPIAISNGVTPRLTVATVIQED
jgi:hypothetical protein